MATTAAVESEGLISGTTRFKTYKLTKYNGGTTVDIVPGTGYTAPVGAYSEYTESSCTFSFVVPDAGGDAYAYIMFLSSR